MWQPQCSPRTRRLAVETDSSRARDPLGSAGLFIFICLVALMTAGGVSAQISAYDAEFGVISFPHQLECGGIGEASVTVVNTGSAAWTAADLVRLGLLGGDPFRTTPRVDLSASDRVEPGASHTFVWQLTAPPTAGIYPSDWRMLREGVAWFGATEERHVDVVCQLSKTDDAELIAIDVPTSMTCGETHTASVTLVNTGTSIWRAEDGYWLNGMKGTGFLAAGDQASLASGMEIPPKQSFTFAIPLTAPLGSAPVTLQLSLEHEGRGPFGPLIEEEIDISCDEMGVRFNGPTEQAVADGGVVDRGVLLEAAAPMSFSFTISPPSSPEITEISNLRVVSVDGPITVELADLAPGTVISAGQGLTLTGLIRPSFGAKDEAVPDDSAFEFSIAFDPDTVGTFAFSTMGVLKSRDASDNDSYRFFMDNLIEGHIENVDRAELPKTVKFRGRLKNQHATLPLALDFNSLQFNTQFPVQGITPRLVIPGGIPPSIPPNGNLYLDLEFDIEQGADTGSVTGALYASPTNSSGVSFFDIRIRFEFFGSAVSLDRISVSQQGSVLSVGSGGTLALPTITGTTSIFLTVHNRNNTTIEVSRLAVSHPHIDVEVQPETLVVGPHSYADFLVSFTLDGAVSTSYSLSLTPEISDASQFPPQSVGTFFFALEGDIIGCSNNCPPIMEVKDATGSLVRSGQVVSETVEEDNPQWQISFQIGNIGDRVLELESPILLSGDQRFSVAPGSPSDLVLSPDATTTLALSFDSTEVELGQEYSTQVTVHSNSWFDPSFSFTLKIVPVPPSLIAVEIVGFDALNSIADIGLHDFLPLPPVVRIVNLEESAHRDVFEFSMTRSQGGPLAWNWPNALPVNIRLGPGEDVHLQGQIALDGEAGSVNRPFQFDLAFKTKKVGYSDPSDVRFHVRGNLENVWNPNQGEIPSFDCNDDDLPDCAVPYCAEVREIYSATSGDDLACTLSVASTALSCTPCGLSGPGTAFCWASCMVSTMSTVVGFEACTNTWPLQALLVSDAAFRFRDCHCRTTAIDWCDESFNIGWSVAGLLAGSSVQLEGRCSTEAGADLVNYLDVHTYNPAGTDLLRCPPDSAYSVSASRVTTSSGGQSWKCKLVHPDEDDHPNEPAYNGRLEEYFSADFDCRCPDPELCGFPHKLTGSASQLSASVGQHNALEVVANLYGDEGLNSSVLAFVSENGPFVFGAPGGDPTPVPAADSYTVALANKPEHPECWAEPTGETIGGTEVFIDVARVYCDSSRPNVQIVNPRPGSVVVPNGVGLIELRASAGDALGISEVVFQLDGASLPPLTQFPYATLWRPPGPGVYSLQARARNQNGTETSSDQITFTVSDETACSGDESPPDFGLMTPQNNQLVTLDALGRINLQVDASDENGMDRVEFFVDGDVIDTISGEGPQLARWAGTLGEHSWFVRVFDACGINRESIPRNFEVVDEGAPAFASLEQVTCTTISGFGLDPDTEEPVLIEIHRAPMGGSTIIDFDYANLPCPGVGSEANCFSFFTPSSMQTGSPETFYTYVQDLDVAGQPTGQWALSDGSPTTIDCPSSGVPIGPSGVSASDGTFHDHVQVTWSTVPDADTYEVYRSLENDSDTAQMIESGLSSSTFDDMGVEPGNTYFYWLKARNSHGASIFSSSDAGFCHEAASNTAGPEGHVDDASCDRIKGWARDPDFTGPVNVVIYRNGPWNGGGTLLANISADEHRGDLPFTDQSHGFNWAPPAGSITDGTSIYVYGLGVDSNGTLNDQNTSLSPSPAYFHCPQQGPPSTPVDLSASDGSFTDKIQLTWSAAELADHYSVWRAPMNVAPLQADMIANDISATSYEDSNVQAGQTYWYWVKAHNGFGVSDWSSSDTGTIGGGTSNTVGPEGLVEDATCSEIVGWARDSDFAGPVNVLIYRSGPWNGGGTLLANVVANQLRGDLQFPDQNHGFRWAPPAGSITHNTTIYIYGLGVDSGGTANGQNTTLGPSPAYFFCQDQSPPGTPTGLSATDGAFSDRVRLSWNAADRADFYTIWRAPMNVAPLEADVIANNVTATLFDDTTAQPGQTYWYWVKAHNEYGAGPWSTSNTGFVAASEAPDPATVVGSESESFGR